MLIVTPEQMRKIDSLCISEIGVPGIVLMENAALMAVKEIQKCLGAIKNKRITLIAGKGNNGGDAFAVSRHLYNKGADIQVFLLCDESSLKGDAGTNFNILKAMGVTVKVVTNEQGIEKLRKDAFSADLIVDGIFGTGLKGVVRGIPKNAIDIVNDSGKKVLSLDIPSGVNGETGKILGTCIKADVTVTFGLPKLGMIIHPGCEYVGRLVVADIGVPSRIIDSMNINTKIIEKGMVPGLIPPRTQNSNKGSYGRTLIITGSKGMTGAGCLSGKAALRVGAGLVYLGVPASLTAIYDQQLAETVTLPLEDRGMGWLSKECKSRIREWLGKVTVAAVGPGLSVNEDTIELVEEIIRDSNIPLILDADALNAISGNVEILKELKTPAIVTPHPGEMARLSGITVENVQNNRIETAREFSCKWNVITVLKGSKTVIASPDGKVYINTEGNSGMATAGTGDVLTGIIAGLVSQGANTASAAIAGVYIHSKAGDAAACSKGEYGLIAGDIVEMLPFALKKLKA